MAIFPIPGNGIDFDTALEISQHASNSVCNEEFFVCADRTTGYQTALKEIQFQHSGHTSQALAELGHMVGATIVMPVSISRLGSKYSISTKLVIVETAVVVGRSGVSVFADSIEDLSVAASREVGPKMMTKLKDVFHDRLKSLEEVR